MRLLSPILLNFHNAGFFGLGAMILAMGLFYGGLAQVIAGILEFKNGNTFGLLAFTSYGFFWLSLVFIIIAPAMGLAEAPSATAMGFYLLIWGIFTLFMFFGTLRTNKVLQFVFASLTLLFFLLALADFTGIALIKTIAGFEELRERVVIVNGVSKAYAMTGWRIGYLAAAPWIVKACSKLQGQFTSGPSSISQKAAVAALNGDNSYTKKMCEAFLRRRDLVVDRISEIDGIIISRPGGAFYIFPDISAYIGRSYKGNRINNDNDFCLFLLDKAHVATVPGEAFGSPGHIRISYAAGDAKLNEAFNRIEAALKMLD